MKTEKTIQREKTILSVLVDKGYLPSSGDFEITETLITQYCATYNEHYTSSNGYKKTGNYRYARKLAALTLMEHRRKINTRVKLTLTKKNDTENKCGFVYITSNPAFPGTVKVGITKDINARLATYQTYDPTRSYKIEHYEFFEDVRSKEKKMLNAFSIDIYKGEWIPDDRKNILKELFDNWPKAN